MVDFSDREQVEAALKALERQVQVAFGARCALRALPGIAHEGDDALRGLAFPVLRATLQTAAVGLGLDANAIIHRNTPAYIVAKANAEHSAGATVPRAAANAASSAAAAAFDTRSVPHEYSATGAHLASATVVFYANPSFSGPNAGPSFSDRSHYYNSAMLDFVVLANTRDGHSAFGSALWKDGLLPEGLAESLQRLRAFWDADPETWGFWRRWYDGMLAGQPLPWDLQEQVALIPDDIWEAGPEAVAPEIARIEQAHRTEVLPRLVRDNERGVFAVEDDPLPPEEVAEFVCERVGIALRVALESATPNGFDDSAPEALEIRLTLEAQQKSVSVLATGFYAACLSFTRRIGDVYPEEASLLNLKNTLWGATEELCALDEKARARCARLAALETRRDVDPTDREMAKDAPEMVGEHVDDSARAIIESDVERILTEVRPPKTVLARFTNWMTTISIWMDRGMKADKKAKWLADLVERLRGWWNDVPPGSG